MGSNTTFDDAVCEFAGKYADQNLRDYGGFVKAIREGQIPVASEGLTFDDPNGSDRVRLPPRQADAPPVFLARHSLVVDVERRPL